MEPRDEPQPDPQLEAFLDGQLDLAAAEAYARKVQADPALRQSVDLQQRMDAALKRLFPISPPDPHATALWLAEHAALKRAEDAATAVKGEAGGRRRNRYWIGVAVAASIAWCAVVWQLGYFRQHQPFFEPRPLLQLYRETLQTGFKPYYECRDEGRFADTFRVRQGTSLKLASLPAGTRMLGLSYVGGLSRQTTAMLCMVGKAPVMVFVDRASHDTATASHDQNPDVHVFRTQKYGLVFYEVSPLPEAHVTEFMEVAD